MHTEQMRPRKRATGGRPRLDRDRHLYRPQLELPLVREMVDAADAAGDIPLSVYMELVVSAAHDYHGPYLPSVPPLRLAVGEDELRRRTAAISRDARSGAVGQAEFHTIRLDRELADRINSRCDELDMAYADYLRIVLRIAHGHTRASLRAAGIQDSFEFDEKGVGSRQRAS